MRIWCALSGAGSDEHLQAISRRKTLSQLVTDALLERGSRVVLQLLAANAGARFSMQGFGELVHHARNDETLQFDLATRADLPQQVVDNLSRLLSDKLRHTLRTMGLNSPRRARARRCSRRCICACPRRSTSATARRARSRRSSATSRPGYRASTGSSSRSLAPIAPTTSRRSSPSSPMSTMPPR